MKIGIIGAGNIGRSLGHKWADQGHEVVFGVREPQAEKVLSLLETIENGATANVIEAAVVASDVVLFAIPGRAMAETVATLGSELDGKILIDASNNVGRTPMHQLQLLRQVAPAGLLFRAFSNLGWENFATPVIDGVQVDLFYCGDGGDGQATVDALIAEIGLRPIYIGGVDQVDIIDALTQLWFVLALQQGRGRCLAFKLIGE